MTRILCAVTVLLAGSFTLSAQNQVHNGSFEEPQTGPAGVYYLNLPGWTVVAASSVLGPCPTAGEGCVEVQRLFEGSTRNQHGNQWLELDLAGNTMIYQDVATVPNQRYMIRFRMANRQGSSSSRIEVLWDGTLIGARTATSTQFARISPAVEVTATKTVHRLGFRAAGTSNSLGDLIDDIELLPIAAAGSAVGYNYYLAQFADGGAWLTTLSFSADEGTSVSYTAYASFPQAGAASGGTFTLAALENTVRQDIFPGTGGTTIGWILVRSVLPIRVTAVYRQRVTGRTDQEVAVLDRALTTRELVPYDHSAGFGTGIALANPGAATITITLTEQRSRKVVSFPLNALSHTAFVVTEKFPEVAGLRGTIEIKGATSSGLPAPFVPFGVRAHESGSFAALPY